MTPLPKVLQLTPRWIVVDKPAGWLTVPGRDPGALGVLSAWAKESFGEAWVVHRLDRDTTGLVLMARTAADHRWASMAFQEHRVTKQYDFLALGTPGAPVLRLDAQVEGRRSVTQAEVLERFAGQPGCFLGRARPVTGRRHQIRVHLSGAGHPLLGDAEYGGPARVEGAGGGSLDVGRPALHAAKLELPEGAGAFAAPWPADFEGWVRALRAAGGAA